MTNQEIRLLFMLINYGTGTVLIFCGSVTQMFELFRFSNKITVNRLISCVVCVLIYINIVGDIQLGRPSSAVKPYYVTECPNFMWLTFFKTQLLL